MIRPTLSSPISTGAEIAAERFKSRRPAWMEEDRISIIMSSRSDSTFFLIPTPSCRPAGFSHPLLTIIVAVPVLANPNDFTSESMVVFHRVCPEPNPRRNTISVSLPDTKMLENIPQHLVRGDFADDGA